MENNQFDQEPLISLSQYRKSGRAPVEMHHLIFNNKDSLESFGAITRYGRKWLISESHLYQWLRKFGKDAGRVRTHDKIDHESFFQSFKS
jgi:hypothetical protein